ncbi:c-type cytochrome [Tundrisphaera sp. TA3]|uniref:c-type cytochrome n=1 Tax=Tundrisphaera sp. TA3 TaxID=3435775 RepID=UPI003EB91273
MKRASIIGALLGTLAVSIPAFGDEPDPAAVERGRVAMTGTGYLKPGWTAEAYARAGQLWDTPAPDPSADPEAYAAAFRQRYGLPPAPFPNDGLPMGLRRGNGPDGTKVGMQIDCLTCHGGSIGGTSYVGIGNTTLDLKLLLNDLTRAEGRRLPPQTIVINSSRGTVNAGMFSVILLSLRNPDLSFRMLPLPLGANLPEIDVPAWWLLAKKKTMYYDGRTEARSVRSNMQFMLGEKTLEEFKDLEPTFRDIQAYLKSLKAPRYPFPIDAARADRGRSVFEASCARCHGTYGPDGKYPNKVVDLETIGTDPARSLGLSDRMVAHYNSTWFGEEGAVHDEVPGYQAPPLDGVWATAPYLHNGSVPTLATLLRSGDRPARFYRPPSTDFGHYDRAAVGWKFDLPAASGDGSPDPARARYLFDSSRFGLGNGGHTFGDKLTDDQRADVIEYLKTL